VGKIAGKTDARFCAAAPILSALRAASLSLKQGQSRKSLRFTDTCSLHGELARGLIPKHPALPPGMDPRGKRLSDCCRQPRMRVGPSHTRGIALMKIIVAIIKPFKLEEVRNALNAIGVQGMTATEVKGYGRQKGHSELYRGAEYAVSFLPKIKIEVAVPSDMVERAIEAIITAAKTGHIGDGKIFVLGIESAVRIRTGETDSAAL
jgi:nitrogen regulatory protein P-II 2